MAWNINVESGKIRFFMMLELDVIDNYHIHRMLKRISRRNETNVKKN